MTKKSNRISDKIVTEILDKGLANSNWRDNHPEAYKELLSYRQDMEQSCRHILTLFWNDVLKEQIQ